MTLAAVLRMLPKMADLCFLLGFILPDDDPHPTLGFIHGAAASLQLQVRLCSLCSSLHLCRFQFREPVLYIGCLDRPRVGIDEVREFARFGRCEVSACDRADQGSVRGDRVPNLFEGRQPEPNRPILPRRIDAIHAEPQRRPVTQLREFDGLARDGFCLAFQKPSSALLAQVAPSEMSYRETLSPFFAERAAALVGWATMAVHTS